MKNKVKVKGATRTKLLLIMKRRGIFILLFFIVLLTGVVIFVKNNFGTTNISTSAVARNYWVVKVEGIDYPFELTASKSIKIIDFLSGLGIYEVDKVYLQNAKSGKEISPNEKITSDMTIKIQMK